METPGTPVAAATVRRPQLAGGVTVDLLARPSVQRAVPIDGRSKWSLAPNYPQGSANTAKTLIPAA